MVIGYRKYLVTLSVLSICTDKVLQFKGDSESSKRQAQEPTQHWQLLHEYTTPPQKQLPN